MKTILHCIDTTGPGGAETVFSDLATRLPAEKYRSLAVIRGKGWVEGRAPDEGHSGQAGRPGIRRPDPVASSGFERLLLAGGLADRNTRGSDISRDGRYRTKGAFERPQIRGY